MVWVPSRYEPDNDPVVQGHLALVNDPAVTPDRIAAHFTVCFDLFLHKRDLAGPAIRKRMAVDPILDDPANATHPMRRSWELQYNHLVTDEIGIVGAMLWEVYHLAQLWDALSVKDRVTYSLHTTVGLDARTDDLGRALAFIDAGPIQQRAPLPHDYEYPDSLIDTLPIDVSLMILDTVPF